MRKYIFLVVLSVFLAACQNGLEVTEPNLSITDIVLLSAKPNIDGSHTYEMLLPLSVGQSGAPGLQIGEGEIQVLYPAQNQIAYYWEYTTANADIFFHFGPYRNENGQIAWLNEGNLPSKYAVLNKGYGITFRDGAISPVVNSHFTTLQAVIDLSAKSIGSGGIINVDGSRSGPNVTRWQWDFGDGASDSGQIASHVYLRPGIFTISLVVTDNLGNRQSATTQIAVVETIHPGDVGDDFVRFSFDYQDNIVKIYFNFSKITINSLWGKYNVYGNFSGPEMVWILYTINHGLAFETHHNGWFYIEQSLVQPIMVVKCGYSAWYDGTMNKPNFPPSSFDHMKDCIYYNGQDLSFIIYSDGKVLKGP